MGLFFCPDSVARPPAFHSLVGHPFLRAPTLRQVIYIALQGKTPHVPPRYILCDLAGIIPKSVSGSCGIMVRYSRSCICHTEFGIREPEFGNRPGYNGAVDRKPLVGLSNLCFVAAWV